MTRVSPHRNSRLAVILLATALTIVWGKAAMAMTLNSPAFQPNGHIPSKYTCEGENVSPPLAWEGVPNGGERMKLEPHRVGGERSARQSRPLDRAFALLDPLLARP